MGESEFDSCSYLIMNLLLYMQFIVLFGGSYGQEMSDNCSLTLEGYTWQFNPEMDEAIPGISSSDDCAEECLSLDWCVGYTWSLDDSAGSMCYLFHQLKDLHPCNDCSECISGKFNPMKGVCNPDDAEDIIAVESYESFQSGEMACFVQENQDGPCNNYKVLNDRYRYFQNGATPQKCDMSSHPNVSPDWQGHAWYRILPPAGTEILTYSPGTGKCGTAVTGWIDGFPAINQIGQTLPAKVRFYSWIDINITLCTDTKSNYYVYQLPNAPSCNYKYCTK